MGDDMLESLKSYAEKLTAVPSVSGFEGAFADLIVSIIGDKVESVQRDVMGNVIAFRGGRGRERLKLLFEAHMDQIGLMITRIEENGILRFTNVGGINPLALFGKRVKVFGKKEIFGVIGMKPPHIAAEEEISAVESLDRLFIDAGYSSKTEAEELVTPGDIAVLDYRSEGMLADHFCSSGLDNKAGVLALLAASELLETSKNYHDVYFLFSTQEEVGLRGAKVGGFTVSPDAAFVCEVTFGDQTGSGSDIRTGKGPVVGKGPNFYPPLVKLICDIAKREDIPIQEEIEPRPGGTDAYYLQITKQGVYTATLAVPLRYMHSQTEIICMKDVYRAAKILVNLAGREHILQQTQAQR